MFGPIGGPELILILILALLLFGPRKLPQIGRTLGKAMAEFRSATQEFKATLDREVALDDLKQTRQELKSAGDDVRALADSPQPGPSEPSSSRPDGGSTGAT